MAPPPKSTDSSGTVAGGSSGPGEGSEGPPGGGNVINLMTLTPPQLQQLKQQIEQELNFYQDAVFQLKDVQTKMQEAGNCVKSLSEDKKELLLPLTPSLYVMGEVESIDNVIIDIGTGYHVEKTRDDAIDYFKRKVEFLTTQIERVQQAGREKSTVRGAIAEVLEGKLKAQISQLNQQNKTAAGK